MTPFPIQSARLTPKGKERMKMSAGMRAAIVARRHLFNRPHGRFPAAACYRRLWTWGNADHGKGGTGMSADAPIFAHQDFEPVFLLQLYSESGIQNGLLLCGLRMRMCFYLILLPLCSHHAIAFKPFVHDRRRSWSQTFRPSSSSKSPAEEHTHFL